MADTQSRQAFEVRLEDEIYRGKDLIRELWLRFADAPDVMHKAEFESLMESHVLPAAEAALQSVTESAGQAGEAPFMCGKCGHVEACRSMGCKNQPASQDAGMVMGLRHAEQLLRSSGFEKSALVIARQIELLAATKAAHE